MAMLSKACKPDNFELHNSRVSRFTNILVLRSNFVVANFSLNQNLLTFLLCVRQTWIQAIDSGNFSVRSYLPLIRKDSSNHMHGLAVYVKEGVPFAQDLPLENSADS